MTQGYAEDGPVENDNISQKIAAGAAEGRNPFREMEAEYEDALAVTEDEDEDD